jgi:hypothetical protein
MANNKDFIVKNDIEATNIIEGLGTISAGTEGYDVSGASYDSVSFSVASQEANPMGLFFKPDGTKMFVTGLSGDDVNEYALSSAWNISSASFTTTTSVSSQFTDPSGLYFKSDGTVAFICSEGNTVYQYNLGTAWDISTLSYASKSFSVASQESSTTDLYFKDDGTKMYVLGSNSDKVHQYSLSSAYDVSTASYDNAFLDVSSYTTQPEGLFFSSDGKKVIVGGHDGGVDLYTLSSAWSISTASYSETFDSTSQTTEVKALSFKDDGAKMYLVGTNSDTIHQYTTTKATSSLDLSTGSVFNFTPTSNTEVTLTNPAPSGTVSQATLVYNSQDTAGISGNFSSTLYTGNGGTQTVTTGIDLSSNEGLVWLKDRSATNNHALYDTVRGATYGFEGSNSASSSAQESNGLTAFTSTGFSLGNRSVTNNNNATYVSWNFKSAANFFDVISYTGTQDGDKTLSHNLGSAPGMVIIKNVASGNDWYVYHRSRGTGKYLYLNLDNAEASGTIVTAVSSSSITVSQSNGFNSNSASYIVYLFGHSDTGGPISCGQYTGNSNSTGPEINVGFEPQFVMVKRADAAGPGWNVYDNARGVSTSGNDKELVWNTNAAEVDAQRLKFTATGFQPTVDTGQINGPGDYIYMAIAAEGATTTTYNNTIDWPGGTAPTSPAIGETDVLTFSTSDGGATYKAVHAIDGAK